MRRAPRTIKQLQKVGLLHGLEGDEAWRLYDAVGRGAPITDLLRLYYAADGDAVESLWRRQSDAYAEAHKTERPSEVAQALLHAMPDIGSLKLTLSREALAVANDRHTVTVSQVVRHSRVRTRVHRVALTSPRHVVQAVNALLAHDDHPRRFVELACQRGLRVFVGLEAEAARTVLEWRATTHPDVEAMYAFACWDRAPSVRAVG